MCFNCGFMSHSGYTEDKISDIEHTSQLIRELASKDMERDIYWYPSVVNMGKLGIIYPDGTEFDWKDGNPNYKGHDIGVIAQDVESVLPDAVSTKPDGTKGVHYNKLIPLLIEAVKDLSKQVDDLSSDK